MIDLDGFAVPTTYAPPEGSVTDLYMGLCRYALWIIAIDQIQRKDHKRINTPEEAITRGVNLA